MKFARIMLMLVVVMVFTSTILFAAISDGSTVGVPLDGGLLAMIVSVPLDGGLLAILGAAGVAYYVARKKRKASDTE